MRVDISKEPLMRRIGILAVVVTVAALALAEEPGTKPATRAKSADEMLNQMLRPRSDAPKPIAPVGGSDIDATSGRAAVAPGAPQVNVMREGTFVIDRTGRLTRRGEGELPEFTFEADGQAMQDPPVLVLPNLKLMAMEDAVAASSRDLRFRITGIVTEYRGRNYVLLEKVVVVPDAAQQF
jgi:hypothetical protein